MDFRGGRRRNPVLVAHKILVDLGLTIEDRQKDIDQFLPLLQNYLSLGEERVVCLFDSVEEAGVSESWLTGSFFDAIRNDILENLVVVVAGRRILDVSDPWDWHDTICRVYELPRLRQEHVREELVLRGLSPSDEETERVWHASLQGVPLLVGTCADLAAKLSV